MGKRAKRLAVKFDVELDKEKDGRWIAQMSDLPGVMVYGSTKEDAFKKLTKLAEQAVIARYRTPEAEP